MTIPHLAQRPAAAPIGGLLLYSAMVIDSADKTGNFQFAQAMALNGWLICDGHYLAIAKYSELGRVIGQRYAPSTGPRQGFFYLPDFRGQFIRAQNLGRDKEHGDPDAGDRRNAADQKVGDQAGSWQDMMIQDHSHIYLRPQTSSLVLDQKGSQVAMIEASKYLTNKSYTATRSTDETPSQETELSARETRPVNFYTPILIRYTNDRHRLVAVGPKEGYG